MNKENKFPKGHPDYDKMSKITIFEHITPDLVKFLKENLRIRASFNPGGGNYGYDSMSMTIELVLGDEAISEEYVSM